MLTVDDLLEYADSLKQDKTTKLTLIFVTRHLKPGMRANAKVIDKFDFKLIKAPIESDIAEYFKEILSNQIVSHLSKDTIELKNYTVIDDDIDNKIYTYALNNAISFSKVVTDDIKSDSIPELTSLSDIKNDLWAYCIKLQNGSEFTYSFRKISKGKLTTDEPQTLNQKLFARFDKNSKVLKEFDGSAISFDDKIDCIYIQDHFYVFRKKSFESIVGLEEEFIEVAQKTIDIIKTSNIVDGLDILEQAIMHKSSIRKTLSHIAQKGTHLSLENQSAESLNNLVNKFNGTKFQVTEEGNIKITTEAEGILFLKLLNDYYKQGLTTQNYYASDSGNLITPTS